MPERYPHATVVRLETNYRSTPQVLELANRLVRQLGGAEKRLQATRLEGPEPVVRAFRERMEETAFVIRMRNKPGALARVAARLARAGVNIKSVYATTAGRSATVVLTVGSVAKARKILR